MPPRPTPSGEDLAYALASNIAESTQQLLTWDDACRKIAGTFRTNWPKAEEWLRERRDDGTLGWYSLGVEGSRHYVKTVNAEIEDRPSLRIYVHPGKGYGSGAPILTSVYAEAHDSWSEMRRQGPDRLYWVEAEEYTKVVKEAESRKAEEQAREDEERAKVADAADPLIRLFFRAGIPAGVVNVYAHDGQPSLLVNLSPAHVEALNKYLIEQEKEQGIEL